MIMSSCLCHSSLLCFFKRYSLSCSPLLVLLLISRELDRFAGQIHTFIMFFNKINILSLILAACTLSGSSLGAPVKPAAHLETSEALEARGDGISYLYRADSRSPAEIAKAGGMWAKGYSSSSKIAPDISLYNHVKGAADSFMSKGNDGYVSFSSSKTMCESWIDKYFHGEGYIYEVHAYKNLIDVQATLKQYNVYPQEKEFAAIKGVSFAQIKGWNRYRRAKDKKGTYTAKDAYVPNKQYSSSKFSGKPHAGAQYSLAGFPKGHPAWKQAPWSSFAACPLNHRRATTSDAGASCGPAKTNQQYAQAYVDDIEADKA